MPVFFVPGTSAPDDAERQYQNIRTFVDERATGELDDDATSRIYQLVHVGNEKQVYTVGEVDALTGSPIAAIFEAHGPNFYVCSPQGDTISITNVTLDTNDVVLIIGFDVPTAAS
jgi:hypothetical protein